MKMLIIILVIAFTFSAVSGNDRFPEQPEKVKVVIKLIDNVTHKAVPGVIRIRDGNGSFVLPADLLNRSAFIKSNESEHDKMDQWFVLPEGDNQVILPKGLLIFEAFQGIRTKTTKISREVLSEGQVINIPLEFFDLGSGKYLGNVHLHYKNIDFCNARNYTLKVPGADGLDVVFFSHLDRPGPDSTYVSNLYSKDSLNFFTDKTGIEFGFGEEYRHNYGAYDEGYGHVMFLGQDAAPVMRPASFGRGLMGYTHDNGTINEGILKAREQSMTVLWCHNKWGLEDIANAVAGVFDGMIIFDQGSKGSYSESFYKYLNVGVPMPFVCGTDWFLRDMSATIVELHREEPLTIDNWLKALKAGKTLITNGPLITLDVNGNHPGDTLTFSGIGNVNITATVSSRKDFISFELICNGRVIKSAKSEKNHEGLFVASIQLEKVFDRSVWLAARVKPFTDSYDNPQKGGKIGYNEFGKPCFAHTSPVYLLIDGKSVFIKKSANQLIQGLEVAMETISKNSVFTNDNERKKVIQLYLRTKEELILKINNTR